MSARSRELFGVAAFPPLPRECRLESLETCGGLEVSKVFPDRAFELEESSVAVRTVLTVFLKRLKLRTSCG